MCGLVNYCKLNILVAMAQTRKIALPAPRTHEPLPKCFRTTSLMFCWFVFLFLLLVLSPGYASLSLSLILSVSECHAVCVLRLATAAQSDLCESSLLCEGRID